MSWALLQVCMAQSRTKQVVNEKQCNNKVKKTIRLPPGGKYWACPGGNGWPADCKGLQAYNEGAEYKVIQTQKGI